MAQTRTLTPGYTVIHPNRDKTDCKVVKVIVVGLLIASVALMLLVSVGGWSELEGLKPMNFVLCILYVIIAFYIWRWSRGALPVSAALAILVLMVAVVAGTGLAGTSWFDRNNSGFAHAQSIFGTAGFPADLLGTFTVLLIPVQVLLIIFAMIGFAQGWNVEVEVPIEEAKKRGSPPVVPPAQPSPA
jgi:lysylphosphatidylglycerol synthetase-like protein (DUF2156 family)